MGPGFGWSHALLKGVIGFYTEGVISFYIT